MKKFVIAAVASFSLCAFAGEAPEAKKVDAKPTAHAAPTTAAAKAEAEPKKEVKEEKKEVAATEKKAEPVKVKEAKTAAPAATK